MAQGHRCKGTACPWRARGGDSFQNRTERRLHAVRTAGRRFRSLLEDVAEVAPSAKLLRRVKRAAEQTDAARDATIILRLLENSVDPGERHVAEPLLAELSARAKEAHTHGPQAAAACAIYRITRSVKPEPVDLRGVTGSAELARRVLQTRVNEVAGLPVACSSAINRGCTLFALPVNGFGMRWNVLRGSNDRLNRWQRPSRSCRTPWARRTIATCFSPFYRLRWYRPSTVFAASARRASTGPSRYGHKPKNCCSTALSSFSKTLLIIPSRASASSVLKI